MNARLSASDSPAIVRIHDLSFRYPDKVLFSNISCSIPSGLTVIVDDDSRGKTSLLQLIAGELIPQHGDITFLQQDGSLSPQRQQNDLFWVDPQTDYYDQQHVRHYFDQLNQYYPNTSQQTLSELTEALGLTPHLDKAFYMLSTGSKRKAWIAAGLASGARLVLLDNPYAALDAISIRYLDHYLAQQLHQQEQAIVITCYEIPDHFTDATCIKLPDLSVNRG